MARARQQYMGVYENMDFPEYKFQEYPKVVGYRDDKKKDPIIVGDAREEVDFITTGFPGAHVSREEELQVELERKAAELEAAKKQLETGRRNVNEVMFEVGYNDVKAFRELFKKITGLSPVDYRNKYNKSAAA